MTSVIVLIIGDRTRNREFKGTLKLKLLRSPFPALPWGGRVRGSGRGTFFVIFWVPVLCCAFDRLLVVLGCHLGSFWAPKIHQNATCEVLCSVDIVMVFPLL